MPHHVYVIFESVSGETNCSLRESFPQASAAVIPQWYEEIGLNRAPFRSQRGSTRTFCNALVTGSVGNILFIAKMDDLHNI